MITLILSMVLPYGEGTLKVKRFLDYKRKLSELCVKQTNSHPVDIFLKD